MVLNLSSNLEEMGADPIRSWIKTLKELGAERMFTIGIPDPLPREMLEVYAKAAYEEDLTGKCNYCPVTGEDYLREKIIEMERNFGVNLTPEDMPRLIQTLGASQALQFLFSLFQPGSEILFNVPGWGTVKNMINHSGNKCVPVKFFEEGSFVEENASKALTDKTQAAYINYPNNPTGTLLSKKALSDFSNWCVANDIQIISDSPYKYLIYEPDETPYVSPVNLGDDVNQKTSTVSSFSKVIKPDIRLGFTRVAPEIMENPRAGKLVYYFRNLGAGTPRAIQAGVKAVLDKDIKLEFLRPIVEGYRKKIDLLTKLLTEYGCSSPDKTVAAYITFMETPNNMDGGEFVKKMASDYKLGFIPGESFGGNYIPELRNYFRAGVGGGQTPESIEEYLSILK